MKIWENPPLPSFQEDQTGWRLVLPCAQPSLPLPVTWPKCGHRRGAGSPLGEKVAGRSPETLRKVSQWGRLDRPLGGPPACSCYMEGDDHWAFHGDVPSWLLEPELPVSYFLQIVALSQEGSSTLSGQRYLKPGPGDKLPCSEG